LRRFEAKPRLVDVWEAASQEGAMRFYGLRQRLIARPCWLLPDAARAAPAIGGSGHDRAAATIKIRLAIKPKAMARSFRLFFQPYNP